MIEPGSELDKHFDEEATDVLWQVSDTSPEEDPDYYQLIYDALVAAYDKGFNEGKLEKMFLKI